MSSIRVDDWKTECVIIASNASLSKSSLLPPANVVCEGYVFTGVYLSTGGCAWVLRGGMRGCSGVACMVAPGVGACVVAPGGGVCVVALGGWGMHGCSWGGMHGCLGGHAWLLLEGGHAWDKTRYGDTINERAVRILLECILYCNQILGHVADQNYIPVID